MKKYNSEEEKVLILISSLMVWNKTPAKMREVGANLPQGEGAEVDQPSAEGAPEEGKEDAVPQQQKAVEDGQAKKYVQVPYSEEDFRSRVASEEYEEIKMIEDEVLSFKKDNVRIYILASGIMYGAGESIFENHFKKAWL